MGNHRKIDGVINLSLDGVAVGPGAIKQTFLIDGVSHWYDDETREYVNASTLERS